MTSTYADKFLAPVVSCNEMQNAGSAVYVGKLPNCVDEPPIVELEVDAAVSIGAESIDFTVPAGGGLFLRSGSRIYFGTTLALATNFVTLAQDVTVPTSATPTALTSVDIEPATAAIATTDIGFTWALIPVLSPTNLPINKGANMTDRKDLSFGLQGSEVKVGITLASQIQLIASVDDRAYWDVIYPASNDNRLIFVLIVRSGGVHAWGKAQVGEVTNDGNINEISRPQVSLSFQAPFATPTLFPYLSTTEKADLNEVRKLAGLSILS